MRLFLLIILFQGGPTPADAIYAVLKGLIDGVEVDSSKYTRFGL